MSIDPKLTAIDPDGCGCTECLTGEYRPLNEATDDEIRALFLGTLRDNTDHHWHIEQRAYGEGYEVYENGRTIRLDRIALPIPVDYYRLTANHNAIDAIRHGADYLD